MVLSPRVILRLGPKDVPWSIESRCMRTPVNRSFAFSISRCVIDILLSAEVCWFLSMFSFEVSVMISYKDSKNLFKNNKNPKTIRQQSERKEYQIQTSSVKFLETKRERRKF